MDASSVAAVISELKSIRLVLLFVLLLVALLIVLVFSFIRSLNRAVTIIDRQSTEKALHQELEDLLTKGMANDAFFLASENSRKRPRDPHLHWYLGQANFQLKKFVEAKQAFRAVIEIAPNWEATIEPWLAKIEAEIANAGPKVVN
jgi:cytochrome c-type biogenesis protein CcmH/NrfG